MADRTQRLKFINWILPAALDVCCKKGYNIALAFTCLSQSALESGWSINGLMAQNNAPFGIKGRYKGSYFYTANTKEWNGKNYESCVAEFRAYPTLQEGIADYFDLLSCGRYKECINKESVNECITSIYINGYASDPLYISKILSVYSTIVNDIKG